MNTQAEFRAVMGELDALRSKATLTPEEGDAFKSKLAQAQTLKARIEDEQAADALKAWGRESDGQSAVKAGWSGEAIDNGGDIPEVASDPGDQATLYATGKIGESKIKALKSGAYKDAYAGYLRYAATGKTQYKPDGKAMKVLQEGQDTAGGFWVPMDMRAEVIKKMAGLSAIRRNAYAFTVGSDIVSFPKVVYTTDNTYTAGTSFSWTAEAPSSDISEATNPVSGRVTIPVHTATCSVVLTRALIEDGQFDILGYVSDLLGESNALGEESAFVSGTGVGQPQGILAHANSTVAHTFSTGGGGMYVPSGSSGKVTWLGTTVGTPEPEEGYVGVWSALPAQYQAGAKWFMHKNTFGATLGLVDTTGRPVIIQPGTFSNATEKPQFVILGDPIELSNFIPVPAASSYSVIYGDMRAYYIADRVGLSIEVLREIKALRDEVVLYSRKRVGAQLVHDWRLKVMKLATS
jgi:HK97 family phage major capsid protein